MTEGVCIRRFMLVFTSVLTAAVCGCGAKTGRVEGKATVDGKPAVGVTVIFSGGDNQSARATVQDDGTYQTTDVPVGPVKVAIMPNMLLSMGGMGKGMPFPKGLGGGKESAPPPAPRSSPPPKIPQRYTNVETSGLTLTVAGGRNEFNITMSSP